MNDTQWLYWSSDSPASDAQRARLMQQINQPVMLGFAAPVASAAAYAQQHVLQASFLSAPLPPSLHLQTALSLGQGFVLLRFMNTHATEALTFSLWHVVPEAACGRVEETRCGGAHARVVGAAWDVGC